MQREGGAVGILLNQPLDADLRLLPFAVHRRGQDLVHDAVTLDRREEVLLVLAAQEPEHDPATAGNALDTDTLDAVNVLLSDLNTTQQQPATLWTQTFFVLPTSFYLT